MIETFAHQLEAIQDLLKELETLDDCEKIEFDDLVEYMARRQRLYSQAQEQLRYLKRDVLDIQTKMILS